MVQESNSFILGNYTGATHWPGEHTVAASDFGQCVAPVPVQLLFLRHQKTATSKEYNHDVHSAAFAGCPQLPLSPIR